MPHEKSMQHKEKARTLHFHILPKESRHCHCSYTRFPVASCNKTAASGRVQLLATEAGPQMGGHRGPTISTSFGVLNHEFSQLFLRTSPALNGTSTGSCWFGWQKIHGLHTSSVTQAVPVGVEAPNPCAPARWSMANGTPPAGICELMRWFPGSPMGGQGPTREDWPWKKNMVKQGCWDMPRVYVGCYGFYDFLCLCSMFLPYLCCFMCWGFWDYFAPDFHSDCLDWMGVRIV